MKGPRTFFLFIAGSLALAVALVLFSLHWYHTDGTSDIDLSLPNYENVRDQIKSPMVEDGISSSGVLDDDAFKQFDKMYKEYQPLLDAKAFDAQALSDDALKIQTAK